MSRSVSEEPAERLPVLQSSATRPDTNAREGVLRISCTFLRVHAVLCAFDPQTAARESVRAPADTRTGPPAQAESERTRCSTCGIFGSTPRFERPAGPYTGQRRAPIKRVHDNAQHASDASGWSRTNDLEGASRVRAADGGRVHRTESLQIVGGCRVSPLRARGGRWRRSEQGARRSRRRRAAVRPPWSRVGGCGA